LARKEAENWSASGVSFKICFLSIEKKNGVSWSARKSSLNDIKTVPQKAVEQ
jgi:hypothetical protein